MFIGETDPPQDPIEVDAAIIFADGQIIRRNEDDDDWMVIKIVTQLDNLERLIFVERQ
jgi:hypothetical protein